MADRTVIVAVGAFIVPVEKRVHRHERERQQHDHCRRFYPRDSSHNWVLVASLHPIVKRKSRDRLPEVALRVRRASPQSFLSR